jgi:hypothetical protein
MMASKFSLLIFILILSTKIHSEENPGRPKIIFINKDIDGKEFAKKYDIEKPMEPLNVIPDLQERDDFFSGMKFPESWDDLNKDMFYIDVHQRPLSFLIEKYPEIKKDEIVRLLEKKK